MKQEGTAHLRAEEELAELFHSRPFKHANFRKCGYSSQRPKHCQPALSLSHNRGRGSSTTHIEVHKVQFSQPVKLQKAVTGWIAARAYFFLLKHQAWQSHRQLQIRNSSGFSCGFFFFFFDFSLNDEKRIKFFLLCI